MSNLKHENCRWLVAGLVGLAFISTPAVVYAEPATIAVSQATVATITIKGVVVDETGEPLIGASVNVKGASAGVATDMDGAFSLVCKPSDVIVISYVGYLTKEVVAEKIGQTVVLEPNNEMLDEVVVIGYGTTTKKSAVSAVDQIKNDAFENRPVANMTQALQGASPSIIVQRKSQNPTGENNNFNIRGVSTLNDNSPLFVIDGLVSDGAAFNRLNPMDIENVSVLKDAGSAAIYGSRSANGVILVTTKKGKKGEGTKVRFSGMVGWEQPHNLYRAVAGYQNATLYNLANTNAGLDPKFTPDQIRDLYEHRSEEQWFKDQIFRTAMQQSYTLGVSGGTDRTTYMLSFGYFNQASNYVNDNGYGLQRYSMRSNISTELGRFKITGIMSFTRTNTKTPAGGFIHEDADRIPSYYYYKLKDANGHYLLNDLLTEQNPLGALEAAGYNKNFNNSFTGNVSAELKIIEGLKLRGVVGVDVLGDGRYTRRNAVTYYYSDGVTSRPGNDVDNQTQNWNADSHLINTQLLLDFNRRFGVNQVNALLGATNESYSWNANDINKNYVDTALGTSTEVTTGELGNMVGGTWVDNNTRTSITSVLGRVGYSYDDRYFVEANFRYDGASKFHKDYRWGFFPSGSVAWRISQERFMDTYRQNIGDLKVRASYGILGSQAVGPYDRFTTYTVFNNIYAFNNQVVSGTGFNLGKEDLTWEKTHTWNFGLDATFFHGTLRLTADYFHKRTNDILMAPLVPSVFGTGMPMDNIGKMQNQGWEISLAYNLNHGDFHHAFNFNIGDTKNKVLTFPGKEQIRQIEELSMIIREGVPLNSYYGYKMNGFFQSWDDIESSALPVGASVQPGDVKFVDRNGDGVIDAKDKFILGNAFPRYTFGFTYNFEWKGIDFAMFWQGVGKRDMMLRGELIEPYHHTYGFTMYEHQLDFWTPTNTDARWPRL